MAINLKNRIFISFLIVWTFFGSVSCKKHESDPVRSELEKKIDEYNLSDKGLKYFFNPDSYFYMGVAVSPSILDNQRKADLIKRHFNSVTAENDMKWSGLQPTEGNFTYTNADKIVAFARANGIGVRGHCLIWHNQTPSWVFLDNGATASKELVLKRLRDHITAVVTHFKGKVYAWDVVNEAIDDGSATYRASQWYTICGEDYITEAYKAARAADPDAKLIYNDYNEVSPAKRDKIFAMLQNLKSQNLVDGIGMQGHWNVDYPSSDLLNAALEKYKTLGIEIQVTEMDVSVYTSNSDPQTVYTETVAGKLAEAYTGFFNSFISYSSSISGVTFWGLADDKTWLDNFPVQGRKNYPLLFDTALNPKLAYFDIIDLLKN